MYTAAEAILGISYQNPTLYARGSYHHHLWHLGRTDGVFGLWIDTWRIQPLFLDMRVFGAGQEEEGEADKWRLEGKNAYETE